MRVLHVLALVGLLLVVPRILTGASSPPPLTQLADGDVLGCYWMEAPVPATNGDVCVTLVVELINLGEAPANQLSVTLCDPTLGVDELALQSVQTAALMPADRLLGVETITVPEAAAVAWKDGLSPRFGVRCEDPSGVALRWDIPFVMTPLQED